MIDMWQREFKRRRSTSSRPAVPSTGSGTAHQNQLLRERAFRLLPTMDRERVIDTLLIENVRLSWRQAENIVRWIERIQEVAA